MKEIQNLQAVFMGKAQLKASIPTTDKSQPKDKEIEKRSALKRLHEVFANPMALSTSCRKQSTIGQDFLLQVHDLDFDSLDILRDLCGQCEEVGQEVLRALVAILDNGVV